MMRYIPVTPGGTFCMDCAANTKEKAIENLLKAASHMPYNGWEEFKERGYIIWDRKGQDGDEDE